MELLAQGERRVDELARVSWPHRGQYLSASATVTPCRPSSGSESKLISDLIEQLKQNDSVDYPLPVKKAIEVLQGNK